MLSYVGILRWWNMDSYYSLFWFRWRQTLDPFDLSCVKSRAPRWGLTIRHSGTWAHSGNNVRHATSPGVSLKRYIKTCLEFRVDLWNGCTQLPVVPTSFGQEFCNKKTKNRESFTLCFLFDENVAGRWRKWISFNIFFSISLIIERKNTVFVPDWKWTYYLQIDSPFRKHF